MIMATEAVDNKLSGDSELCRKVDEEEIIRTILYDDWEQVLILLAQDMDPWDIDIVKLSNRFTAYIKKIREMNLRVPARIILAASIIYRMKCDALFLQEMEDSAADMQAELLDSESDAEMMEQIYIPPIRLPLRRQVKRRITLEELVEALNKAMRVKKRRELREMITLELNQKDLTEHIEKLYQKILEFLEKEGLVFFSELVGSKPKEAVIRDFTSLLHLMNEERVICEQEELFGEILIRPANQ